MGVKHHDDPTLERVAVVGCRQVNGHVEAGSIRTICPEYLIPNPFHILQENLLTAAVIEFCGPAVGMAGDSLSGFQGAVIFQKIRDAGRPKRVRRIVRRQSGLFQPSFEHVRGVSPHKRPTR